MPSYRTIAALAALALTAFWPAARAVAETPAERGRYLVESISGCGNCHTQRGPDGAPVAALTLAGGALVDDNPAFRAISSNITSDPETGIGKWTDDQIVTAIREGRRPDGTLIGPPMPFEVYRGMGDADVRAIVAFLRTVPPVRNVAEKSVYRIALPPAYGPPVVSVTAPSPADHVAYGAYLAGPLGHCIVCHSPIGPKGADFTKLGLGGNSFGGPWGTSVSSNITSSKSDGLGAWTDAEIEHAIRDGVARDGRKLMPPMGFDYYARISPSDMTALIAFIRTIPPR
jgi:mono/diheme cytochrome c family protein